MYTVEQSSYTLLHKALVQSYSYVKTLKWQLPQMLTIPMIGM